MCLATVKKSDDTVVCRNISRIDVEGDTLIIRDILGDEVRVKGQILMVDLANSLVKIESN